MPNVLTPSLSQVEHTVKSPPSDVVVAAAHADTTPQSDLGSDSSSVRATPNVLPRSSVAASGWPLFSRLFELVIDAKDPTTLIHRAAAGIGLLPDVAWCEVRKRACELPDVIQSYFSVPTVGYRSAETPAHEEGHWLVVALQHRHDSAARAMIRDFLELFRKLYRRECETQRLVADAMSDPLTGLWNRRGLEPLLEQAVARRVRQQERLALLAFDVDHFKLINDSFGHAAGDLALVTIGTALREICRPSDVPARIGGDEFIVLLSGCDAVGAKRVAQRLQAAVDRANPLTTRRVTLSIGVSDCRVLAATQETVSRANELLQVTDEALYMAKEAGRARVHIHPRCHDLDLS